MSLTVSEAWRKPVCSRKRRRHRRSEGASVARAVRKAGGHEAEELARDGSVDAVPDRAPRGRFGGSAALT